MSNDIVPSVEVIGPDYKQAYYELALLVALAREDFSLGRDGDAKMYIRKAGNLIDRISSSPRLIQHDNSTGVRTNNADDIVS